MVLAMLTPAVVSCRADSSGGAADGESTVVGVGSTVDAPAQGVRFDHFVVDDAPPSADGCCLDVLAVGDVDGDGAADIVIGAENADGLSWYRNPGDGSDASMWDRFAIGEGDFTTDGEVADVDGDGDLDVVASSIDRNVVEWWEQVGDPQMAEGWTRHEIGPDFAHDLVIKDIDGDNDLDVAAFHHDAQRVDWFEQTADPTQAWMQHIVDEISGEGLAVDDVDGDGDVDMVAGSTLYINTVGSGRSWDKSPIVADWPDEARPIIADIDNDGANDIVLAAPETKGRLSWFRGSSWEERVIDEDAGFTHSLETADIDHDGHLDLMVGVMHFDGTHEIRVLFGDGGATWSQVLLASTGTHNARLADLDGDGSVDVVGKNFDGPKRVEVWWARPFVAAEPFARPAGSPDAASPLDGFTHVLVDDQRDTFNESTPFFGLAFDDLDADGDGDIASGKYLYLNPGGMSDNWERIDLAEQIGAVVDVMLTTDVDGDDRADLIASSLPDVWWLEAGDDPHEWTGRIVGQVPATSRPNGQGYRAGDLDADGRPEIVLSGGSSESEVWYLKIPPDPEAAPWPTIRVTNTATDEQIGIGDINGDGLNDIAAGDMNDGGSFIAWFENPGDGSPDWVRRRLGQFPGVFPDRVDLADLDGDGRLDVVVTEENDGTNPDAEVMWYRQPDDPTSEDWQRNVVTTQYTTNGLDVADMDGDGDVDLVTGEHRGTKKVSIWENVGATEHGDVDWVEHPVSEGIESHLGARMWDLDGDGDLEIVSIGFDAPERLDLWIND